MRTVPLRSRSSLPQPTEANICYSCVGYKGRCTFPSSCPHSDINRSPCPSSLCIGSLAQPGELTEDSLCCWSNLSKASLFKKKVSPTSFLGMFLVSPGLPVIRCFSLPEKVSIKAECLHVTSQNLHSVEGGENNHNIYSQHLPDVSQSPGKF